ncbi:2OG-Fe(II) oxygenase [Legionella rowbothamii]|uniref:2OG-Fe(II) oxygenase n=1 Tax=Legionella rowbothamii TaxID=96229 RepID=UPI001054137F|nr:2OG-Fe(II) oxygenase [Legionella rowbothamii]
MQENTELLIDNLCNQGFHLLDGFLSQEYYLSLRTTAKELYKQGLFRSAKIGLNISSQQNNAVRTDEILWLESDNHDPAIQFFINQIQQLCQILNQNLFLGIQEFETHFASYQPGTFYKKHIDQFAAQKTRKVSFVYYLNENWQDEYGGQLNLYNTNHQLLEKVTPKGNRLICFNSELPHEVVTTNQTRYSITGWMKTRPLDRME